MNDWPEYQIRLRPLRARLLAEFTERSAADSAELLAAFATDRGRYELWQAPDAATPELHLLQPAGQRRLVVNFADLADLGAEFLLGDLAVSPDGQRLAYTLDPTGADMHELRLVDLDRPALSQPIRQDLGAAICWHDGQLVGLELDANMSPTVAVRLAVDNGARQVLHRAGPGEYLDLTQATDGRSVLIGVESHCGNQMLLLAPGADKPEWLPGGPDERVRFDTAGGAEWLLWSPASGPDRLMTRTIGGDWRQVATAAPGSHWDEVAALAHGVVLVERQADGQRLQFAADDSAPVEVQFSDQPEEDPASYLLQPGGAELTVLRESWRAAPRLYQVDGHSGRPAGPASPQIPMAVHRVDVPSADGAAIAITVLGPAHLRPPWPIVLYAYGAYGVPVDPYYTPFRASLLDRGVGFAVAHVRGGGERGPAWHEAGRGRNKIRAIEDYLASAHELIASGWCPPDGLVARCRSAGGAVIGAAINSEPELFRAAVLEMPFVDCLRTLSDPAAALTELEWAEWGNPISDAEDRIQIASWSPVDNVKAAPYPALLVTTGLTDVRVPPDGPRRYVDAIRAATTGSAPAFLIERTSGHAGHSDIDQDWQGEAELLAFILDQLEIAQL